MWRVIRNLYEKTDNCVLVGDEKTEYFGVVGRKVAILLYADDIVLIADNAEGLQRGMGIATSWGRKWQCIFNRSKWYMGRGRRKMGNGGWEEGKWSRWTATNI